MRTAEFETVRYRTAEMQTVSRDLLKGVATFSGIEGTVLQPYVDHKIEQISEVIEEQLPKRVTFTTKGLSVIFSGFPLPLQRREGNRLVASSSPPYFTLEQGSAHNLSVAQREELDTAIGTLIGDMNYIHRIVVDRSDPLTILTFPKEIYAERIEVERAIIL